MRICHGLPGESLVVDSQELQWRSPLDVIKQRATECWEVSDDLIVLASGGATVNADSALDGGDVFFFLRSDLDPKVNVAVKPLTPQVEREDWPISESSDPAFEALHSNIAAARQRVSESRSVANLVAGLVHRLDIQRLAAQAVQDNLRTHRATCSRSIELFLQKYERVQEKFDQNMATVELSVDALCAVPLHASMRAAGRETLADVVPRDRVTSFSAHLQAERTRLVQRMEKFRRLYSHAHSLCDKVSSKVEHFLHEDTALFARIQQQHLLVESELLPVLQMPSEGAPASSVLEQERRSGSALESLCHTCGTVHGLFSELQAWWSRRHGNFVQRLREVAYAQSKVSDVERQAALLEEEINAQRSYSQQLGQFRLMPKAYQKTIFEVARRRQFCSSYLAHVKHSRASLLRMVEDENARRRGFSTRYGCLLPVDLVPGLGSLVPPPVVDVPVFDALLPDIDFPVREGAPDRPRTSSSAPSIKEKVIQAPLEVGSFGKGSDNSSKTARELEARNALLEAQINGLTQELLRLRAQHGTNTSCEETPVVVAQSGQSGDSDMSSVVCR